MNIFLLLSKYFLIGSTICQIIMIVYVLLDFIQFTNWFQTLNSVQVTNKMKKNIDLKKQNPLASV